MTLFCQWILRYFFLLATFDSSSFLPSVTRTSAAARAGTNAALRGCVNDVRSMFAMLRDCYGFEPGSMICLIDEDPNAPAAKLPTGANIKNNLKQLVAASQPGDVLFFHFSGHGTQVRNRNLGQQHMPSA